MKKFIVVACEEVIYRIPVKANSEEEAKDKVWNGEVEVKNKHIGDSLNFDVIDCEVE